MRKIFFKRLHPDAVVPEFKTAGGAGADLYSVEDVHIAEGETKIVKLGFAVSIPHGYEIQVRPRSGLAIKHGITVLNSPGTVDSDYRGEMMVILSNFGKSYFKVKVGDRIAQAVVSVVPQTSFVEVEDLDVTERGAGGFGSTGTD